MHDIYLLSCRSAGLLISRVDSIHLIFKYESCFQHIHNTMQTILCVVPSATEHTQARTHTRTHSTSRGTVNYILKERIVTTSCLSHTCNCSRAPATDATDTFSCPGHTFLGQQVTHNIVKSSVLRPLITV